MTSKKQNPIISRFVPNLEAVNLLEYFLISAITSLLIIRAFLSITGYPQLGGGNLHIAHILWGGLFMLVSLIILLSFINSESRSIAAILGGIGFGTFIDELGKFLTSDNDYFYQPTIALIYVLFVIIYFTIKFFSSYTNYSKRTYAANTVEGLKELVISDYDEDEKIRYSRYLKHLDEKDPVFKIISKLIKESKTKKAEFSFYKFIKSKFLLIYKKTIRTGLISKALITIYVLNIVLGLIFITGVLFFSNRSDLGFSFYGYFISLILSGYFTVKSIYSHIRKRIIESYLFLEKATLVSIFLSQFFLFLSDEFGALLNLVMYVTTYTVLRYSISAEAHLNVKEK